MTVPSHGPKLTNATSPSKIWHNGTDQTQREKPPRPPSHSTNREKPLQIHHPTVPAVLEHKFLSVILDQELKSHAHINYALTKGTKWVTQYHRLAKNMKGVSAKYMRRLYIMVAIPHMLYATDLFFTPQSGQANGSKGQSTTTSCSPCHRGPTNNPHRFTGHTCQPTAIPTSS